MNIILDTNFLIDCARFKLDLDSLMELEGLYGKVYLIVLDCCYIELEGLTRQKNRQGLYAKLALEFLKDRGIIATKYKAGRTVDDAIISYSKKYKYIVATNDRKLITRLKSEEIRVIRIRQRKGFVME